MSVQSSPAMLGRGEEPAVRAARKRLHRALVKRLLAGAALAVAIFGLVVAAYESWTVDRQLAELAAAEAQRLVDVEGGEAVAAEESAIWRRRLESFMADRARATRDHFILAELYDPARVQVAEEVLPEYARVEHALDDGGHIFPEGTEIAYERSFVGREMYLRAVVPLLAPDGSVAGYFEGVFRISEATLGAILQTILQVVLGAVGAVATTALVLYPLLSTQQRALFDKAQRQLDANITALKLLGNAIALRDSDTHAHNYRVTIYSIHTGLKLGLGNRDIERLIKGAFLHDVGKIGISDSILLKPGRLTEDEFATMKQHVLLGSNIVATADWLGEADEVVRFHHEKFDGSGYPAGVAGMDIPLAARIFAVADVFDALTSERPYKKPMPVAKALAILEKDSGSHFDPDVVRVFRDQVLPELGNLAEQPDEAVEARLDALIHNHFRLEL